MHINAGLFTLALAGFNSLAAAQPHKPHLHARHHLKGRNVVTEFITKTVDQNGNLYSTSVPTPTLASASALAPVPDTTSTSVVTATLASASSGSYAFSEESYSSSFSSYSSSSHYSRTYSSSQSEATSVAAPDNSDALAGIDKEFPDGELDCSTFPSDYGAISLPWVTKDGWSSIQINGGNGDSIGKCTEGALCSYACPPGYSKAQWPALQPASGESHGGLECKGGKLYRTRDDFTKLCEVGAGTAKVINKLGDYVAICRTDYPGSENMVIPLSCDAGSAQTLTVPNSSNSYVWRGSSTSAQYYVNNAGIALEEGCIWGPPNGGRGNWSPVVIGAGYSDDKTWLSISQNSLNSDLLNYNIKIVADDDSEISQDCRYEGGKFSTGDTVGCTVAVTKGSASFVLYK